jgi:hypothetical protein
VLRKELIDRLAARRPKALEWQRILDDLADLSEIEVEQDGRGSEPHPGRLSIPSTAPSASPCHPFSRSFPAQKTRPRPPKPVVPKPICAR